MALDCSVLLLLTRVRAATAAPELEPLEEEPLELPEPLEELTPLEDPELLLLLLLLELLLPPKVDELPKLLPPPLQAPRTTVNRTARPALANV
jgi:hypothetical protein